MSLAQQSRPFIQHIDKWLTALPTGWAGALRHLATVKDFATAQAARGDQPA